MEVENLNDLATLEEGLKLLLAKDPKNERAQDLLTRVQEVLPF